MNEASIRLFLQALGVKQMERKGKWVSGTCPLAPFLHQGGKDNNPSFGMKIDGHSPFNCFACESGSPGKLLQLIAFHVGKVPSYAPLYDLKTANAILEGAELDFLPLPDFESEWADEQVFVRWPSSALDMYAPIEQVPEALEYLATRDGGLSLEQAQHAGLRYDYHRKMICCPYWNAYGSLAGIRGRSIDPNCPKAYRHYDYTWQDHNNAPLVWYNEPALNLDGPVIVVEGQFDCRHVEKVWPKVIANLTAKPSHQKLKKLSGCDSVILMMDNDETGENATKKYLEYLGAQGIQTGVMEYPAEFHDPAQLDLQWLSDALYG